MGVEQDREILVEAQSKGRLATLGAYVRLSGPGWLQSAITLGGGSLASSLYLGVLAGFTMLWLQPIAMLFGIVMLSAIGYVTLSTGERPLQAINNHVNPVLGWSWAAASLVANMVWCLPQYSLANAVVQQNLFPDLLGSGSALEDWGAKLVITAIILVVTVAITWSYDSKGRGIRIYEAMLKTVVAMIVVCFGGVVVWLSFSEGGLDWNAIFAGFVPDLSLLSEPAPGLRPLLEGVRGPSEEFWRTYIIGQQRDVMISAFATAVGINMTFLLPYSLLKRGWTKEFRGLLGFDMFTGMLIPFVLATSCVIIASANRFHPTSTTMQMQEADIQKLSKKEKESINSFAKKAGKEKLSIEEKRLAYSLLRRDAIDLARSLEPLTGGRSVANIIFGLGVLGMTLSTITLLMLISGMVVCEMFGVNPSGWPFRFGCLAAVTGALGPFVWSGAGFYLAVPTSVFGATLLPIAYLSFVLLINQKRLLKDEMPHGPRRFFGNIFMAVATLVAAGASFWAIWQKTEWYGVGAIAAFTILVAIVHFKRTDVQQQE